MFKLVVSDPKTKRTYQKEVSQKESGLIGRKIRDKAKGDFLGLPGYELEITGGSDKQGFPMRFDVQGTARKRVLLTGGPGFHPKTKGERRRKSVRGNTISPEIIQVNAKITKYGSKKLEEIFRKPKEKPKEEAKPEKKAEEKPEEKAKEEPEKEEAKPPEKEKKEEPKEKPKEETKKEEKAEKPEKEEPPKEKEKKPEEEVKEEEKKPEAPKEEKPREEKAKRKRS